MSFYCDFAPGHEWHGPYHDAEYGFPQRGDAELFERLILEINQAGLSWLTILKKREAFRAAYRGFDPAVVARFGARDVRRLMADAGVIRNRLKIEAAIANAKTVLALRTSHGSLAGWLDGHLAVDGKTHGRDAKAQRRKDAKRARTKEEWVALFRKTFRFTGGEIVGEFLLSTGYLPGAHREDCPVYPRVVKRQPPWLRAGVPPLPR
jgi:DNA-3-methyladenine glycosylase I